MAQISLAQLAREAEQNGQQVKVGNFESFADFESYFKAHYKPMLDRWQQGDADRLMGFFIDDMLDTFGTNEEEG